MYVAAAAQRSKPISKTPMSNPTAGQTRRRALM
jgi:hypothetical protein